MHQSEQVQCTSSHAIIFIISILTNMDSCYHSVGTGISVQGFVKEIDDMKTGVNLFIQLLPHLINYKEIS